MIIGHRPLRPYVRVSGCGPPWPFFAGLGGDEGCHSLKWVMVKAGMSNCRPACGSDRGIEPPLPLIKEPKSRSHHSYRHGTAARTRAPDELDSKRFS